MQGTNNVIVEVSNIPPINLDKRLPEIKSPQEKTMIERQILSTDREIDKLVYELYELTEEEVGEGGRGGDGEGGGRFGVGKVGVSGEERAGGEFDGEL